MLFMEEDEETFPVSVPVCVCVPEWGEDIDDVKEVEEGSVGTVSGTKYPTSRRSASPQNLGKKMKNRTKKMRKRKIQFEKIKLRAENKAANR